MGFADDIAIVVSDQDIGRLVDKTNVALERISMWLHFRGLEMAPEKTEAMMVTTRRAGHLEVEVEGIRIALSRKVKYLGVWLDTLLTFGPHVRETAAKAERTVAALTRLMPNIGGPGEFKRRILYHVAQSVILYGAPIWRDAMGVNTYKNILTSIQRKMTLRVIRAYRTVSAAAAAVLSSIPPIHLIVDERGRIDTREPRGSGGQKGRAGKNSGAMAIRMGKGGRSSTVDQGSDP